MLVVTLGLIYFHENTLFAVENLSSFDYEQNSKEQKEIKMCLREILAGNCSLRKKDFDTLIGKILFEEEKKEEKIKKQKTELASKIKACLSEQRQLTRLLREQLVKHANGESGSVDVERVLESIKNNYQKKINQILEELKAYEKKYKVYQRKQNEINNKLRELINKGEELRIEDLKKLKKDQEVNERKAIRKERQEEVKNLLTSFRQQRSESHQKSDADKKI
ncbi:MAG TPA: hypothetical protein DHV84_06205 [Desulfotomaculum sp.]|nr:hypothetical protein [Desulfotomaculum sp.]